MSNAMINLKKIFQPNPYLLSVSKQEKNLLERFVTRKADYDNWHSQQSRIRFRFYLPAAIDFCYDGSKLFTAFFKKDSFGMPVLHELKMSEANHASIRSANWKPFREEMSSFLQTLEEKRKVVTRQKTMPLQEYMAICEEAPSPAADNLSFA